MPELETPVRPLKRIHVIINPASGQDVPMLNILNRAFREAGVTWDVSITQRFGDAREQARRAVASGVDAVAIYGGDGSVSEAASGLIGSDVPLAILPGGTGNVLAADLGVPRDLLSACALLCGGAYAVRAVDVGQSGEHFFLLRLSIGLEANVVEGADREAKDRLGPLAYALSVLQALRDPPMAHYRLTLDGQTLEVDGMACMIANSGYLGRVGVSWAPNINVDDGLLDVVVIRSGDIASLLAVVASVVAGNEKAEALQHWQARDIRLHADPPQTVQADGDIIGQSPVDVSVLPRAVRLIVPQAA